MIFGIYIRNIKVTDSEKPKVQFQRIQIQVQNPNKR